MAVVLFQVYGTSSILLLLLLLLVAPMERTGIAVDFLNFSNVV